MEISQDFRRQPSPDRGVVQQYDTPLHRKARKRFFQTKRVGYRLLNERFDYRLSPWIQHLAVKTAPKSADTRKTHTEDLDRISIKELHPGSRQRALNLFTCFVDVIFNSGNGLCVVDDDWFARSQTSLILDMPVKIAPLEEMIWQKAYIMERERFDGADIAHLLFTSGDRIDWEHLIARFGPDWRVLLSHLVYLGSSTPQKEIQFRQRSSMGSCSSLNRREKRPHRLQIFVMAPFFPGISSLAILSWPHCWTLD